MTVDRRPDIGEEVHRLRAGDMPVLVLPKTGFSKKYALIGTNYGSIHNHFRTSVRKGRTKVPDGIAHFLEHKMFEKDDGDVMDRFSALGCSSNAMTSFNHTGYLFECTENFEPALELLVDFVTRPYFTPELVEKEKGIIGEEIKMYLDDPGWRGYMRLLESLYDRHPVATDIAGTLESIAEITADDLDLCHRTFYSPDNMHLAVSGDVDPQQVADIAAAVLERNDRGDLQREKILPKHPKRARRKSTRDAMSVSAPKLTVGWMADPAELGIDPLTLEVGLETFFGAVLGKGGALHGELFQEGLIDDSFTFSVNSENEFAFVVAGGDTSRPDELSTRLREGVVRAANSALDEERIRRMRRTQFGSFVRSFNSVATICWNLIDCHVKGGGLLDYGDLVETMTPRRVKRIAKAFISPDRTATHLITPARVA